MICGYIAHQSGGLSKNFGFGAANTTADISGSVKKRGVVYKNCMVSIFNKLDMQMITACKPDDNGNYTVHGLNPSMRLFIVGFDMDMQYNAVISDNVVPK